MGPALAGFAGIFTGFIAVAVAAAPPAPCRIDVVERGSGWPVPLVELRTLHGVRFVSDNAGVVAFDLPELMGSELWLEVSGHGYAVKADGFGYRGVRLTPVPGGRLRVEVERTSLARRLGRVTGAGIFGESQKLGLENSGKETGVLGCDSVQAVPFGGRLFWAWGDTTLPHYPLGIFHMSAAWTPARPVAAFEPPLRLEFAHFRGPSARPRDVARLPGPGPTWLSGMIVLPDGAGRERLVAAYAKIRPPLSVYETGLCVWNESSENFELLSVLWREMDAGPRSPPVPDGQAFLADDEQGVKWAYFGNPFPVLRCRATFEAWRDPARWEKREAPATLVPADGGKPVKVHGGSVAWHPWRRKWVTIFTQAGGEGSFLGDIWYAEAPAPTGPWGRAVKVLGHDNYTFYNPRIHAMWSTADSPVLIFEGTFTREFADRPPAVPRYDYNQIMYRLDLDDPGLAAVRAP
jgi:hypothetical protein